MVGVLKFGQLLGNPVSVMVVDEGNAPDYRPIGVGRPLGDQAIADQIAEGLGSVGIAKPRDEMVEALEKVRIESNSDSAKDSHRHSLEENWPLTQN